MNKKSFYTKIKARNIQPEIFFILPLPHGDEDLP